MNIAKAELKTRLDLHQRRLDNQAGGELADLHYANLDFSCLPLWCGGAKFKCDLKFVVQLLAHIATLDCDGEEFKTIKEFILPYAQKSHRAKDLQITKEG